MHQILHDVNFFFFFFLFFSFCTCRRVEPNQSVGGEKVSGKWTSRARCKQGTKRLARHVEIVADTDTLQGEVGVGEGERRRVKGEDDKVMDEAREAILLQLT